MALTSKEIRPGPVLVPEELATLLRPTTAALSWTTADIHALCRRQLRRYSHSLDDRPPMSLVYNAFASPIICGRKPVGTTK